MTQLAITPLENEELLLSVSKHPYESVVLFDPEDVYRDTKNTPEASKYVEGPIRSISRKYFELLKAFRCKCRTRKCKCVYNRHKEKKKKGHIDLRLGNVKKFKIRPEDLALIAKRLISIYIDKGHAFEFDIPSLEYCSEFESFTERPSIKHDLLEHDLRGPEERAGHFYTHGLPKFPQTLTELELTDCDGDNIDLKESLKLVNSLENFRLSLCTNFKGLEPLPCFKTLKVLMLEGTTFKTPSSIIFLSSLVSLETLVLTGGGRRGYSDLSFSVPMPLLIDSHTQLPEKLECIDISDLTLVTLPESIGNCKNLIMLKVTNCGLKYLPETLSKCRKLEYVNLISNDLQPEGVFVLKDCPAKNISLGGSRALIGKLSQNAAIKEQLPKFIEEFEGSSSSSSSSSVQQGKKGVKRKAAERTCVICLGNEPTHAIIPCGHRCLCSDCATSVSRKGGGKCPICRANIHTIFKIFDS